MDNKAQQNLAFNPNVLAMDYPKRFFEIARNPSSGKLKQNALVICGGFLFDHKGGGLLW